MHAYGRNCEQSYRGDTLAGSRRSTRKYGSTHKCVLTNFPFLILSHITFHLLHPIRYTWSCHIEEFICNCYELVEIKPVIRTNGSQFRHGAGLNLVPNSSHDLWQQLKPVRALCWAKSLFYFFKCTLTEQFKYAKKAKNKKLEMQWTS